MPPKKKVESTISKLVEKKDDSEKTAFKFETKVEPGSTSFNKVWVYFDGSKYVQQGS